VPRLRPNFPSGFLNFGKTAAEHGAAKQPLQGGRTARTVTNTRSDVKPSDKSLSTSWPSLDSPGATRRALSLLEHAGLRLPPLLSYILLHITVGPGGRKVKLVGVVNGLYNTSTALERKDVSSKDGTSARQRQSPSGGARTGPFEHLLCAQPGPVAAPAAYRLHRGEQRISATVSNRSGRNPLRSSRSYRRFSPRCLKLLIIRVHRKADVVSCQPLRFWRTKVFPEKQSRSFR
jgi:hypothetical protein